MATSLLVITLDSIFGELLRHELEETRRFSVRVTGQSHAAAAYAREKTIPLAFLDVAQLDDDVAEVAKRLRQANPDIKLVLVSESGWQQPLDGVDADGHLSKPFYLPDLLEMMYRFFPEKSGAEEARRPAGRSKADLPWLSDVNRAAQHLTRLTLESSAQAALITRDDALWAYAGQLPQEAARELAETVSRYWDRQEESDLVRFVRLQTTNAEHMLYATSLASGMVLALIFDAETPFSTIRSQATNLVRLLSVAPEPDPQALSEMSEEEQAAAVADILGSIPPPNPPKTPDGIPGLSRVPGLEGALPQSPRFSLESSPAVRLAPASSVEETRRSSQVQEIDPTAVTRQHEIERVEPTAVTRQSRAQKKKREEVEPTPAPVAASQPRSIPEVARKIVLEPASPSVYNLSYACLLIPRFAQHHLTGDLADRLGEWLPEICVAFGWRLEQIAVRPDYLQWIVNVPPATSPGYLMRIIRQHTSEKIFADFPRFKKENPSGDFWAPGYLIMGGTNLPPQQLVKEFIAQTRQRQGISQPLR